jgi:1-acyl-sn-glycerol-3-phosphate acyltransferase
VIDLLILLLITAAFLVAAAFLLTGVFLSIAVFHGRFNVAQTWLLMSAWLLVKILWRGRLPRKFPIPLDQAGVVVCNHRSSADPFFVQVCANRPIYWMVAREYCEHPLFRWFLRTCDVIPVNRGGIDIAATKAAIRRVRAGGLVGMFPEGRINMSDQFMLPVRPGAILVASKADAVIFPCYVEGSPYRDTPWSPFFMRARATVHFGEPILAHDETLAENDDGSTKHIMLRVIGSLAEMAGQPDFQPTLAGRRWKPTAEELEADIAANRERQRQAKP